MTTTITSMLNELLADLERSTTCTEFCAHCVIRREVKHKIVKIRDASMQEVVPGAGLCGTANIVANQEPADV